MKKESDGSNVAIAFCAGTKKKKKKATVALLSLLFRLCCNK